MDNVLLLDPELPDDAKKYYREEGNEEVGKGVPRSFLQEMDEVLIVENAIANELAWERAKEGEGKAEAAEAAEGGNEAGDVYGEDHGDGEGPDKKKPRKQAGLETKQKAIMLRCFPGYYDGSYNAYTKSKSVYKKLVARNIFAALRKWITKRGRLYEPEMKNGEVISCYDKIVNMFPGEPTPGKPENDLMLALLKMATPNKDEDVFPWCVRSSQKIASVRRLLESLENFQMVLACRRARRDFVLCSRLDDPHATPEAPTPTKPTKASGKAKAKPKAAPRGILIKETVGSSDKVVTVWEDFVQIVSSCRENVPNYKNKEVILDDVVAAAYSLGASYIILRKGDCKARRSTAPRREACASTSTRGS